MLHPNMGKLLNSFVPFARRETGDVGVELEIEGRRLPPVGTAINGWEEKEEHSLRGEHREYVTRGSVPMVNVLDRMGQLHQAFTANASEIIPSDRCSTHIHVNFQNEPLRVYLGFTLIFVMLEPILLRLCGNKRNGNLFCIPTYETGDLPDHVKNMVACFSQGSVRHVRQRGKYAALCTDHLTTYGTAEARCFPLSTDANTINKWCRWLVTMKNTARAFDDETYSRLWARAPVIAQEVFRGEDLQAACRPEQVEDLLNLGIETAYEAWKEMKSVLYYEKPEKGVKAKVASHAIYDDLEDMEMEENF